MERERERERRDYYSFSGGPTFYLGLFQVSVDE